MQLNYLCTTANLSSEPKIIDIQARSLSEISVKKLPTRLIFIWVLTPLNQLV
jgi:hypothetical protein